jgi:hypothetical protein
MFTFNQALPISAVSDGTSNTMMLGERALGKLTICGTELHVLVG